MPRHRAVSTLRDSVESGQANLLRELIRDCPGIPDPVKEAQFTGVFERTIDASLVRIWAEHCERTDDTGLQRRLDAMSDYVGKKLACIMIALPGVQYTIEVDPMARGIVHWECQVD